MVLLSFNMVLLSLKWFCYPLTWFCYLLTWFCYLLTWFCYCLTWFCNSLMWSHYQLTWFCYPLVWFCYLVTWFCYPSTWFFYFLKWFCYGSYGSSMRRAVLLCLSMGRMYTHVKGQQPAESEKLHAFLRRGVGIYVIVLDVCVFACSFKIAEPCILNGANTHFLIFVRVITIGWRFALREPA